METYCVRANKCNTYSSAGVEEEAEKAMTWTAEPEEVTLESMSDKRNFYSKMYEKCVHDSLIPTAHMNISGIGVIPRAAHA